MLSIRVIFTLFAVGYVAADSTTVVPLTKMLVHEFINTQYAGLVTVGGREYLTVFDTTSCNVILLSQECYGGSCNCPNLARFPNNKNTKYLPEANVTYFDTGFCQGRGTTSSLQIVTLNAPDQTVLLADYCSIELCMLNADGIVGISTPSCQNPFNALTAFGSFLKEKQTAAVFSVHHARFPNGSHYGEVIFGGSDLRFVEGDFTYVPLLGDDSWKFKLDALTLGDKTIDSDTAALVDTSKYIVVGPRDKVALINQAIGCTEKKIGGQEICTIDCAAANNLPPVVFTIGGRNFTIAAEYYIQQNGAICYSGFSPCDVSTHWSLGDYFIDHIYCEFDWAKKRMGLANSKESL